MRTFLVHFGEISGGDWDMRPPPAVSEGGLSLNDILTIELRPLTPTTEI